MTCGWALGWWKSPCGVLGHLFKKGLCQLGGVGWLELDRIMIIKESVVTIDGVRWEQKGGSWFDLAGMY